MTGRTGPGGPRERIRAVVTDVDGTLTDRSRRLDPVAVRAVREIEDRGIPVLLATGNVLPIALALHRSLGLTGPIVAENGGILYTGDRGSEQVERRANRAIALRALEKVRAAGLPVRPLFTDRWRETEVALEPDVSPVRIRAAVSGLPVRVESTGYATHLIEAGIGKLGTVREALGRLGIPLEACVALGDGDNDVELLRATGRSVSFRSGSARARRAARYVARASYAEGLVEGLIHLGLVGSPAHPPREHDAGR